MNKTKQHKKVILQALEKSLGVVSEACKKAGVGRTTFYEWLKDDKEFKKQVDDIEDIALDFAESQLFKNIGAGKEASLIFYLKTKGRKRGYFEKVDDTHAPPPPIIDLDVLTGEEREELFQLIKAQRQHLARESNGNATSEALTK